MSRVGKLPIAVPSNVTINLSDNAITVKGAKGELSMSLTRDVLVEHQDGMLKVSPVNSSRRSRAMWGTVRSRLYNMIHGVTQGFTKRLEIRGVGYRAAIAGDVLSLSLGYSHEIKYIIPKDISVTVDKQTVIDISGVDIQQVGQIAAEIRALRKPEPYKGKGVRYATEYVRSKEGKKK